MTNPTSESPTDPRRLSAIMVLDVVGYSRMMSDDEEGTLARVLEEQRLRIEPAITEHGGRTVKRMGDGILAEFPSVTAAVSCARQIQEPQENALVLRIGINLGEVITRDGDIFGDGVNVAARIEALAPVGGIALSEAAHGQVRRDRTLNFEDMGRHTVKNIPVPVRVFQLQGGAAPASDPVPRPDRRQVGRLGLIAAVLAVLLIAGWVGMRLATGYGTAAADPLDLYTEERPSVAVLPFRTLSEFPEQILLSVGLADNLATTLSHLQGLIVVSSRGAAAQEGGAEQAGSQLNVTHVVSGSVQRAGARVRIHAVLTEAHSNRQIWAERFDRDIDDFFAIQDDVTQKIVTALEIELSGEEAKSLARAKAQGNRSRGIGMVLAALAPASQRTVTRSVLPDNVPASRVTSASGASLEDMALLVRAASKRDLLVGVDADEGAAVFGDPAFRQAAALARMRDPALLSGSLPDLSERIARLGREAQAVLTAGQDGAELHAAVALQSLIAGDAADAITPARQALLQAPSYGDGYAVLAWALAANGQTGDAARALQILSRLAPEPLAWHLMVRAEVALLSGRFAEASEAARKARLADPGLGRAWLTGALSTSLQGDTAAGVAELGRLAPDDLAWVKAHPEQVLIASDRDLRDQLQSALQAMLAGL